MDSNFLPFGLAPVTVLRTEREMARRFAKVSEEEIEEAFFFYASDLVNTKTTILLRVDEVRWIYTSTLPISYISTTIHLPFGG